VFWVGWSWTAVGLAALLYLGRAFGLTAFYHRAIFRIERLRHPAGFRS